MRDRVERDRSFAVLLFKQHRRAGVCKRKYEHILREAVEVVCDQIAGPAEKHEPPTVSSNERLKRKPVSRTRACAVDAGEVSLSLHNIPHKHVGGETICPVGGGNEIIRKTVERNKTTVTGNAWIERAASQATRACKIHGDKRLYLRRDVIEKNVVAVAVRIIRHQT